MQREEEEAAKIYESFVESFGEKPEDIGTAPKSFVRGGTIQPGSAAKDGGSGTTADRTLHYTHATDILPQPAEIADW